MDGITQVLAPLIGAIVGVGGCWYVLVNLPRRPVLGPIVCIMAYFWIPPALLFGVQQAIIGLVFLMLLYTVYRDRAITASGLSVPARTSIFLYVMFGLLAIILFLAILSYFIRGTSITVDFVKYVLRYCGFMLFGATVVMGVRNWDDCHSILHSFVINAFVACVLVGYYQFFSGTTLFNSGYFEDHFVARGPKFRLVTFHQHDPNYVMLDIAPLAVFAFALAQHAKDYLVKSSLYVVLAMTIFASILTFSRSGIAVFAASLLIFLFFGSPSKWAGLVAIVVAASLTVGVMLFVGSDSLVSTENYLRLASLANLDWRLELMATATEGFLEHPILGRGGASVNEYIWDKSGHFMTAHSLYVTTLFRHGIVGATVVFSLLLWSLHRLVQIKRSTRFGEQQNRSNRIFVAAVLTGLISYLLMVASLSDSLGFYFCFYISLTFALSSLVTSESRRSSESRGSPGLTHVALS